MELLYERKNVNNIIRTQNELLRIVKLSLEDLAKEINRLQSRQIVEPSKFGKQLKRNKQLQKALINYQKDLYRKLDDTMQLKVSDSWGIANAKNDDLVRMFIGSIPTEFARPNLEQLEIFLKRKTKGLGLSERLWNLSNSSVKLVEDYLATGITQGKSANKIASELNKMINNPKGVFYTNDIGERVKFNKTSDFLVKPTKKGQYKNPVDALKRLARNEINTAYRTSNYERMQQLDFVVGYEVHLSAAHDAYDICDTLVGKYPKNFIFSGFHVNCYSDDTEVMTKEGWKLFKDVTFNDLIFSLNPNTRTPEYVGIDKIMNRSFKGDMINYKSTNLDILVTPDHDMVYLRKSNGDLCKRKAKEFKMSQGSIYRGCEWKGESSKSISIGKYSIDFNLYCEFMGYYLADGSFTKSRPYHCTISQQRDNNTESYNNIKKCLDKLPIKYTEPSSGFHWHDKDFWEYLGQFKKAGDKFIPTQIMNANKHDINTFLDAFISCDGYIHESKPFIGSRGTLCKANNPSRKYFTSSELMCSQLGELILKKGNRPSFKLTSKKGTEQTFTNGVYATNYNSWIISECYSKTSSTFKKETIPYDGKVYDVELNKNHIMYVRRNGKCAWGSNCMCYVTSILMTKAEFKARQGSIREVKKVPVRMERLVKTMHAGKVEVRGTKSFVQMEWYKDNFRNGLPLKKIGGARDGVKAYKTRKDLTYKASSKKYLQKAKKGL